MAIEIFPVDKAFPTSPDAGHPDCICSRCAAPIGEDDCPTRVWTTNYLGDVDDNSLEYRYCIQCEQAMGIHKSFPMPMDDVDDSSFGEPEDTNQWVCRVCGCHEQDACSHPEHGNCW